MEPLRGEEWQSRDTQRVWSFLYMHGADAVMKSGLTEMALPKEALTGTHADWSFFGLTWGGDLEDYPRVFEATVEGDKIRVTSHPDDDADESENYEEETLSNLSELRAFVSGMGSLIHALGG